MFLITNVFGAGGFTNSSTEFSSKDFSRTSTTFLTGGFDQKLHKRVKKKKRAIRLLK